jgi:hypothetical protein
MGHPRLIFVSLLLGVLAFLTLIGAVRFFAPDPNPLERYDVALDLHSGIAQSFEAGDLRGWIVRLPGEELRVLSARSPHLGCYIDFRPREDFTGSGFDIPEGHPGLFRDICYGSTYLLTGERIFGPSPRGMDMFEVRKVHDSFLTVDLSRVRTGLCGLGISSRGHFSCSSADHARYGIARPPEELPPSMFH